MLTFTIVQTPSLTDEFDGSLPVPYRLEADDAQITTVSSNSNLPRLYAEVCIILRSPMESLRMAAYILTWPTLSLAPSPLPLSLLSLTKSPCFLLWLLRVPRYKATFLLRLLTLVLMAEQRFQILKTARISMMSLLHLFLRRPTLATPLA